MAKEDLIETVIGASNQTILHHSSGTQQLTISDGVAAVHRSHNSKGVGSPFAVQAGSVQCVPDSALKEVLEFPDAEQGTGNVKAMACRTPATGGCTGCNSGHMVVGQFDFGPQQSVSPQPKPSSQPAAGVDVAACVRLISKSTKPRGIVKLVSVTPGDPGKQSSPEAPTPHVARSSAPQPSHTMDVDPGTEDGTSGKDGNAPRDVSTATHGAATSSLPLPRAASARSVHGASGLRSKMWSKCFPSLGAKRQHPDAAAAPSVPDAQQKRAKQQQQEAVQHAAPPQLGAPTGEEGALHQASEPGLKPAKATTTGSGVITETIRINSADAGLKSVQLHPHIQSKCRDFLQQVQQGSAADDTAKTTASASAAVGLVRPEDAQQAVNAILASLAALTPNNLLLHLAASNATQVWASLLGNLALPNLNLASGLASLSRATDQATLAQIRTLLLRADPTTALKIAAALAAMNNNGATAARAKPSKNPAASAPAQAATPSHTAPPPQVRGQAPPGSSSAAAVLAGSLEGVARLQPSLDLSAVPGEQAQQQGTEQRNCQSLQDVPVLTKKLSAPRIRHFPPPSVQAQATPPPPPTTPSTTVPGQESHVLCESQQPNLLQGHAARAASHEVHAEQQPAAKKAWNQLTPSELGFDGTEKTMKGHVRFLLQHYELPDVLRDLLGFLVADLPSTILSGLEKCTTKYARTVYAKQMLKALERGKPQEFLLASHQAHADVAKLAEQRAQHAQHSMQQRTITTQVLDGSLQECRHEHHAQAYWLSQAQQQSAAAVGSQHHSLLPGAQQQGACYGQGTAPGCTTVFSAAVHSDRSQEMQAGSANVAAEHHNSSSLDCSTHREQKLQAVVAVAGRYLRCAAMRQGGHIVKAMLEQHMQILATYLATGNAGPIHGGPSVDDIVASWRYALAQQAHRDACGAPPDQTPAKAGGTKKVDAASSKCWSGSGTAVPCGDTDMQHAMLKLDAVGVKLKQVTGSAEACKQDTDVKPAAGSDACGLTCSRMCQDDDDDKSLAALFKAD